MSFLIYNMYLNIYNKVLNTITGFYYNELNYKYVTDTVVSLCTAICNNNNIQDTRAI